MCIFICSISKRFCTREYTTQGIFRGRGDQGELHFAALRPAAHSQMAHQRQRGEWSPRVPRCMSRVDIKHGPQLRSDGIERESISAADERGLVSRTVVARLTAHRELFMKHTGLLEMRCEVAAPHTGPLPTPPALTTTVYMSLLELRGQKFDWLSSSGIYI